MAEDTSPMADVVGSVVGALYFAGCVTGTLFFFVVGLAVFVTAL